MGNQLAGFRTGSAQAKPIDDVVKPQFKQLEQIFARLALHALGILIGLSELTLKNTIETFGLLLFTQLGSVFGYFLSALTMLTGSKAPSGNRAFSSIAPLPFEEEFFTFPAA